MNGFIHLEGELLQIKGATKVTSSTPTQAMIELGGNAIVATGNGIEVKKLNLEILNLVRQVGQRGLY